MLVVLVISSLLTLAAASTNGIYGGEASFDFVNKGFGSLRLSNADGSPLGKGQFDAHGWPTVDAKIVVFDDRPTDAWKPPIDDPQTRQADFSGLWRMTLTGRADVALKSPVGITLVNSTYDSSKNRQTAFIKFAAGGWPKVQNLLVFILTNTARDPTAGSAQGGFTACQDFCRTLLEIGRTAHSCALCNPHDRTSRSSARSIGEKKRSCLRTSGRRCTRRSRSSAS